MRIRFYIILLLSFLSCNCDRKEKPVETMKEITFNKTKWRAKKGTDYLYRDLMLKDIVYNDTVRTLNKDQILELLGDPDRINDNYLYYTISQKRLGYWPLHTKSLVIKLSEENNRIEWIKIHE